MWFVTCPVCGHHAKLEDFAPSVADECGCPKCDAFFTVDFSADDDEDDQDDGG